MRPYILRGIDVPFVKHVGLYAGSGMVIDNRPEGVRFVAQDQFAEGRTVVVARYRGHRLRREIVRCALGCLGEKAYDLLRNNCEHLVHLCQEGRARSDQVESWGAGLGGRVLRLLL